MEITVNMQGGSVFHWSFGIDKNINLMVAALKENLPGWDTITIVVPNRPSNKEFIEAETQG